MDNKYKITEETINKIKGSIINTDNKLVKFAGINVLDISERHIKLEMPLRDVNVNHIGTAYAVSMIMLMEVAGASLIRATYGFDRFIPIIKKVDVSYLKPTSETLVCDLSISEEQAEEMIAPIEKRGKGNYIIPIDIRDNKGDVIAAANFIFYLLPMQ